MDGVGECRVETPYAPIHLVFVRDVGLTHPGCYFECSHQPAHWVDPKFGNIYTSHLKVGRALTT